MARQLLLERSASSPTEALEAVAGLQTQYAPAGYIGLWSRLARFDRVDLTRALEERRVIQGTMMRGTIHMVSAADYWPMIAGIRRVTREWYSRIQAREMAGTDLPTLAAALREELAEGPIRAVELTARLEQRGFPSRALAWGSLWVELVRVPPSGTWERRRADLYGLADAWLPPVEIDEDDGIELLIRRYLGAFGPASLRDIATWMGFNVGQMRHVAERLELQRYRSEDGKPLFDLPGAPLPHPETPAPVRFLPVWDATLLVHARRTQILPEEYRSRVFNTKTPHSVNSFLVDGQVAGTWRYERGAIALQPFRRLSGAERSDLDEEAERLAAFHAE